MTMIDNERASDFLDGEEEICNFLRRQIVESWDDTLGNHQDVSLQDWLQIHETIRQLRTKEDL